MPKQTRHRRFTVHSGSTGKKIGQAPTAKIAIEIARAFPGATVYMGTKRVWPKTASNPLPVGRYVKVKAIRRKNGRVDLYKA